MPIELTDEDRAAIREATRGSAIRRDGTTSERIYRAGLAAGIERAAKEGGQDESLPENDEAAR